MENQQKIKREIEICKTKSKNHLLIGIIGCVAIIGYNIANPSEISVLFIIVAIVLLIFNIVKSNQFSTKKSKLVKQLKNLENKDNNFSRPNESINEDNSEFVNSSGMSSNAKEYISNGVTIFVEQQREDKIRIGDNVKGINNTKLKDGSYKLNSEISIWIEDGIIKQIF